jgi:transcriptional regulator with XRE-family HTH domain
VETLRELRRRRGWSQKDLADSSRVGQDTISGIESGRHEPRPSTLRKLAEALEVEVVDFFREPAPPLDEAPQLGRLGDAPASAPGPSLSELLSRAGTPTWWLALPEEQWQAQVSAHDKSGAGKRLLQIALEQMEEWVAVLPYLFRGEDALGNPALTPEMVEAWQAAALRKIKTLNALKSMLDDPEVDADQKGYAKLLASLYEGIGRHLENFSSQNFGTHDVVGERPVSGP